MKVSIVVPCFNEEKTVPLFLMRLKNSKVPMSSNICLLTTDQRRYVSSNQEASLSLSLCPLCLIFQKFWEEAALYAGLQASTGDLVTVMDVDLQDPPNCFLR